MPLSKSCSVEAFRENIATSIREGKPRAQSVAIAADALRRACEEADEPLPAGTIDKAGPVRRQRTREFLEDAFMRARKVLHPRDFAMIFQASRASAGGQIAARNRRERFTALERVSVDKAGMHSMSSAELGAMLRTLNGVLDVRKRQGESFEGAAATAKGVVAEMERRGMEAEGSAAKVGKEHVEPAPGSGHREDPGVMVAFRIPINTARVIDFESGEPAEDLHMTVAFLGRMSEVGVEGLARAKEVLEEMTGHRPMKGRLSGLGRFASTDNTDGKDVIYASVDMPGLSGFREEVVERLINAGVPVRLEHGFTPHVTLAFVSPNAPTPEISDGVRLREVFFDVVTLAVGGSSTEFTLGQVPAIVQLPELHDVLESVAAGEDPDLSLRTDAVVIDVLDETMQVSLDGGDPFEVDRGMLKDVDVQAGDMVAVLNTYDDSAVAGFSKSTEPTSADDVRAWAEWVDRVRKDATPVPWMGPDDAPVMFIAGSPTPLEVARGEAMVGPDAAIFEKQYLEPLGLTKEQVAIGFVVPVHGGTEKDVSMWGDHLAKAMVKFSKARVIALGRMAKTVQKHGVRCDYLPHPAAIRRHGNSGEVARKIKKVAKALDSAGPGVDSGRSSDEPPIQGQARATLADAISGLRKDGSILARVIKSDLEKQIIYGVVLDPYVVDLQEDWIPPAEIESTAHGFQKESRVIGFRHRKTAEGADLVETFVEIYPPGERVKAMKNLPHKVYRRKFGDDVIHSGAWVAGVQLPDQLWAAYERGELNAFSIGGFSFKTRVTTDAMPAVEFIDLVEQPAAQ